MRQVEEEARQGQHREEIQASFFRAKGQEMIVQQRGRTDFTAERGQTQRFQGPPQWPQRPTAATSAEAVSWTAGTFSTTMPEVWPRTSRKIKW